MTEESKLTLCKDCKWCDKGELPQYPQIWICNNPAYLAYAKINPVSGWTYYADSQGRKTSKYPHCESINLDGHCPTFEQAPPVEPGIWDLDVGKFFVDFWNFLFNR